VNAVKKKRKEMLLKPPPGLTPEQGLLAALTTPLPWSRVGRKKKTRPKKK